MEESEDTPMCDNCKLDLSDRDYFVLAPNAVCVCENCYVLLKMEGKRQ